MPNDLEVRIREEMRKLKRQSRHRLRQNVGLFLLATGTIAGFAYCFHSGSFVFKLGNLVSKSSHSVDELIPIALPKSGVLKPFQGQTPHDHWARLRLFLRAPLPEEKSSLSFDCAEKSSTGMASSKQHYYIEWLDWQSNKVIATAFIRSGEKVELLIPFGSYKLRYAAGSRWYGEPHLFGSDVKYEMTEPFSFGKTAKFEFTREKPGADMGFACLNGNLGSKAVKDDSQQH